jgi:histidyl-tRNA synthetase
MVNAPKGTKDMLPEEAYRWHWVEDLMHGIAQSCGYREIRTPIFEHTELFMRGVGDTTDIVQKEMYTFEDKGGRSVTLKPEGTAGTVRAYIEHGMQNEPQPVKMYYMGPIFRYERPQKGRYRQHHQFGVEVFGAAEPTADAEVIALAQSVLTGAGINKLSLEINSVGCPDCRATYHKALKAYLKGHLTEMCGTCRERFDRNPLRILDCKVSRCKAIVKDAPVMIDYLCDACKRHFEGVQACLKAAGIGFTVNPRIVRGLDYYIRTVFEFISDDIGAQGTVCGGGRYDNLVETLGGPEVPGLGFGMGVERLLLTMEALGVDIPEPGQCDVFIVTIGDAAKEKGFALLTSLRQGGIAADMDHTGRGVKAQFKYADKIGARYVLTLGEDEIASGKMQVKDMISGVEKGIVLETVTDYLKIKMEEHGDE